MIVFSAEIGTTCVSHTGIPVSRSNVPGVDGFTGGVRCDPEREGLSVERGKSLVRRSPVVAHAYPISPATFHGNAFYVSGAANIHDEDEKPIRIALELKPHASTPFAWNSTYINRITYIQLVTCFGEWLS